MSTAPATVNRAMVGERAWHDPPGDILDRGLAEPAHGTSHVALVAASSLTSERHQGRNLLTSASHHHENQAASLGCCGVVEVTDALLGAVAGVAVGSSGALRTELLATDGHAPIH
jgi:hypothetical protein